MPSSLATLIQAFTLPTDTGSEHHGTGVLSLSHEGLVDGSPKDIKVIRNSIVDPIRGTTNIRLLSQFMDRKDMRFACVDLTLPKHMPTDMNAVLPMAIDMHDILNTDSVLSGHDRHWTCYVEFSDDGYVRGLWQRPMLQHVSVDLPAVMRFAIDASQERCTGVLGKLSSPEWYGDDCPRFVRSWVDCVRGRLCYFPRELAQGGEQCFTVVDFE